MKNIQSRAWYLLSERGTITAAAKSAGVSRRTFRRMLTGESAGNRKTRRSTNRAFRRYATGATIEGEKTYGNTVSGWMTVAEAEKHERLLRSVGGPYRVRARWRATFQRSVGGISDSEERVIWDNQKGFATSVAEAVDRIKLSAILIEQSDFAYDLTIVRDVDDIEVRFYYF